MAEEKITCSGKDGDAIVQLIRKQGNGFPAEVSWATADDDAVFDTHYFNKEGR